MALECAATVRRNTNDPVISAVLPALISRAESTDPCQRLKPASNVNTSAKPRTSEKLVLHKMAAVVVHH